MRRLVVIVCLALALTPALAADVIAPNEASSHVGQNVIVEGAVNDVHHAASGRAIFINMGGRYPDNAFTGVIFSGDFGKFPDVDSWNGKVIDIAGPIRLYRGKAEIILNDPGQVKLK